MRDYLSLVTFSHTVFALPFALIGYALAVSQATFSFAPLDLALVVGCMVFARSAAMGFNRLVDAPIDAKNARTADRDIPAGRISTARAKVFVGLNCALFVVCAGLLNPLCLALSPVALAVVLGYSYTKRFTWLCHFVLGLGLALAPVGAYLAVTGEFAVAPCLYGLVVLLWVGGFDIVYALQDERFDRKLGLNSVPTRFGGSRSIQISRLLHTSCVLVLALTSYLVYESHSSSWWMLAVGFFVFVAALIYQQSIVGEHDLSRIDRAFFTTNGVASVAYALLIVPAITFNW